MSARTRLRWLGGVSAVLLALACEAEQAPPAVERSGDPVVSGEAPAPGSVRVRLQGDRLFLWSEGAQLRDVLEALAAEGGFELLVGEIEPSTLALRIEDASLAEALVQLLAGVPYGVEYERQQATGEPRLARLIVGRPVSTPPSAAPGEPPTEADSQRAAEEQLRRTLEQVQRELAQMSPEERERRFEEHRAWQESREPELLEQLASADGAERAEAALDLPIGGAGAAGEERFQRMSALATEDPDARVRTAAVARLSEAEHPDTVAVLGDALSDEDPAVVLEAIESLILLDDRAAIPALQPLLASPHGEVRDSAEFAIEFLQW